MADDKQKLFFTSDLHIGHRNIIDYCSRPFSSLEEMETVIRDNWNKVVTKNDRVYILGDVGFHKPLYLDHYLDKLNGQKCLVKGNHDSQLRSSTMAKFMWEKDLFNLRIDRQLTVLCHFPLLTWQAMHHGSWMLHGHSHGGIPFDPAIRRYDVGVDCNNFTPISYEEIALKMRPAIPVMR